MSDSFLESIENVGTAISIIIILNIGFSPITGIVYYLSGIKTTLYTAIIMTSFMIYFMSELSPCDHRSPDCKCIDKNCYVTNNHVIYIAAALALFAVYKYF